MPYRQDNNISAAVQPRAHIRFHHHGGKEGKGPLGPRAWGSEPRTRCSSWKRRRKKLSGESSSSREITGIPSVFCTPPPPVFGITMPWRNEHTRVHHIYACNTDRYTDTCTYTNMRGSSRQSEGKGKGGGSKQRRCWMWRCI